MAQRFSGAELRRRREGKGLTRTQLGARIGRSERIVWAYEQGKSNPPLAVQARLAAELECEIADLFEAVDAADARVREHVRALVESWPPLTPAQRGRIAAILADAIGSAQQGDELKESTG